MMDLKLYKFFIGLFFSLNLFAENIILTEEEVSYIKNKKEITMCVDPDWEPFEIINKQGQH
jgi:hypothetical protein